MVDIAVRIDVVGRVDYVSVGLTFSRVVSCGGELDVAWSSQADLLYTIRHVFGS